MSERSAIRGQRIHQDKLERARQLRRKMTPAEALLWIHLRRNSLEGRHFRRQQIIDGFIVDFYCHRGHLVIEVDGPIHEQQREYDQWRETILVAHGLRILRLTNAEVLGDINASIRRIVGVLTSPPAPPLEGEGRKTK